MLSLENEEAILGFEKCMNEKAYESPIFHYWKMIFDLQVLLLQFVRSERCFKFVHEIHFCFESLQLCVLV